MKTKLNKAFKAMLITALIFVFGICQISAKEKFSKTLVDKKFTINKGALLKIDHKFGEVNCKNWSEDAISVKIIATIETANQEKADNILSKVKANVVGSNNEVSVKTDLNDKLFEGKNQNLTIKIEIFMPKSIKLNLDHKFGNAYIEAVEGVSEIHSEYGNIEIGSLTGENSSLEMGFGSGKVQKFVSGNLKIDYSNFSVSVATNLKAETNYSDFSIDKVVGLKIENEGGKLKIGQVDVLQINSKFADCSVNQLAKVLNLKNEYGSVKVKSINNSFTTITVKNSFGSADLYFEQGSGFDINAEMSFCSLEYPKELASFSLRNVSPTESSYKGIIGKGNNTGAKVEIESDYGGVSVRMK